MVKENEPNGIPLCCTATTGSVSSLDKPEITKNGKEPNEIEHSMDKVDDGQQMNRKDDDEEIEACLCCLLCFQFVDCLVAAA